MHHRRGTAKTVVFDLEPDDGPVDASDGAPAPGGEVAVPPSAVGRLVRAVAAWPRRRQIVAVATVVGLAAVTTGVAVTVDLVRDRALRTQVSAAPGGVASLVEAPAVRWRTELANPQPLAIMGGLLVVGERASWTESRDGEWITLTGLDPVDGTVRWSTEVEGADQCGGAPPGVGGLWRGGVGEATAMVCPTRTPEPGVVVVGPDGRIVSRRALDAPTEAETVLPAPGAVLRLARVGPGADAVLVDTRLGADFVTRDMTVRLEDATTGAVRWQTTLPGATAPAGTAVDAMYYCADWGPDGTGPQAVSDKSSGTSWDVGPRRVWVATCGINASLDLATGEVVRSVDALDPVAGWDQGAVPLDDEGYATRLTHDPVSGEALLGEVNRVWREDGTVVGDVSGSPILPRATDGSPADVLLTTGSSGLTAFDATDVATLWARPSAAASPLVRTERVLVLQEGSNVVGLEPRTGGELWNRPALDPRPDSSGQPEQLVSAFTDGHRVVLVGMLNGGFVGDDGAADLRLHALDLSTGTTLWTVERRAPIPQAIGGRLYEFAADAAVSFG